MAEDTSKKAEVTKKEETPAKLPAGFGGPMVYVPTEAEVAEQKRIYDESQAAK